MKKINHFSACGTTKSTKRIVGGTPTTIEKYPWQALITHGGGELCGGSVISDRYIVTAAHCIELV